MSRPDGEYVEFHDDSAISENLVEVLLDPTPPFDVDWRVSARLLDEDSRLIRLARVKALLPADNAMEHHSTHDATLENYIRLALQATGDRETLSRFLETVMHTLDSERPDTELLAQQIFWIWGPVADIAGLHRMKVDLEERAFAIAMPEECARIREVYEATDAESMQTFLEDTRQLILEAAQSAIPGLTLEDVSGRPKTYYGIWRKHQGREEDYTISDFMGFRVVVDGATEEEAVERCYAVAGEVCAYFEMDPDRFKNYIAQPKANGYRSLHLTLYNEQGRPIELQIRTRAMHEAAESEGEISHLLYDAAYKVVPGKIFQHYRRIPKLYSWREVAARRIQESSGSTEILGGQILFFRTDGNLYLIEETGATALDGAFRIQSERALRASAIYINGKLAEFSDPLSFGDLVDVQYREDYPTDPLYVGAMKGSTLTERAHKAIERARRQLLRDELITRGKEVVLEKLGSNFGLKDLFSVLNGTDRRYLAKRAGVSSLEDLLFIIGNGNKSGKPTRIANLIRARLGMEDIAEIKPMPENASTVDDKELLALIHIPHLGGEPECRVAGCCSHQIVVGDEVVARPLRSEGKMSLHRIDCANVRDYPGLVQCIWDSANLEE